MLHRFQSFAILNDFIGVEELSIFFSHSDPALLELYIGNLCAELLEIYIRNKMRTSNIHSHNPLQAKPVNLI